MFLLLLDLVFVHLGDYKGHTWYNYSAWKVVHALKVLNTGVAHVGKFEETVILLNNVLL